ncbi:MAG: site-2 protease family protein, partial [bacterium]
MSGLPTSVGSEPAGYKLNDVKLTIVSVLAKSPAEKAGLKSGDKIVSLDTFSNTKNSSEILDDGNNYVSEINPDTLKSFIVSHGDKEINIGYMRGKSKDINYAKLTPITNSADSKPSIGISMDMIGTAKLPIFMALKEGMSLTLFVTKGTVVGLYTLISEVIRGKGSLSSVTGPVGMVGIVGDAYEFGFSYLLSFAALISINLAIINLLPFPALDGGRLFFLLIEKIKGSRLNPKFANTANMIGFGILILLMVVVTFHDIVKLF